MQKLSSWTRSVALASLTLLLVPVTGTAQQQNGDQDQRSGRADEISPAERQEWRALANARFLTGDVKGALDALNEIGEPRVGSIKIEGLVRTNRQIVNDYMGLEPGELLTAEKLTRIWRRLDELPVASSAKVRYDAISGSAIVRPIVFERDLFPSTALGWTPVAARALFQQEVRVDISDLTGWGEVWSPSYRWDQKRPRLILRTAVPAPGALPGVLRFETLWERQSYQNPSLGVGIFREQRFRAGAALSDWITSWLRWEGGAAIDHIEFANYLGLDANLNARAFGDRFAVILTGGQWYAMGAGDSFVNGEFVMTLRSTPEPDVPVFTTLAGIAVASKMAPLALWPGASSGQARGALLRAHPLHHRGIITGEAFGRQLWFTSTEYEHPIPTRMGMLGIAGFVDTAQATLRLDPTTPSKFHVDIGAGLRVNTSRSGNKVRLDFGYGLRDGNMRVSAGYIVPWGRR